MNSSQAFGSPVMWAKHSSCVQDILPAGAGDAACADCRESGSVGVGAKRTSSTSSGSGSPPTTCARRGSGDSNREARRASSGVANFVVVDVTAA